MVRRRRERQRLVGGKEEAREGERKNKKERERTKRKRKTKMVGISWKGWNQFPGQARAAQVHCLQRNGQM